MEACSGVLVCFTNLLVNLDATALRYFAFKVVFKPLTERLSMLKTFKPGNFKAEFSRIRFNPVNEAEVIVAEFELECAYRKQGRRSVSALFSWT
ncbi:MAG: hypothetical protein A2Z99_01545 [Treponema sp. GWB1_62_6]|nr:MAG: hypothetical protein A2Y36_04940 [Treponema sp. GWA1_62_8]OHE68938.1 MAG: hypothetical protein A2Z99_01545 [Treponema sp. GWB1_62_6]OHE69167.1 MAG: hypothetical protein A2001_13100 [Treponema sp. GWC1_61_84]OHE75446.1 MAG: hypothetical protein A2413_13600 [Treponema sp. RIFOXYC1_FULL_61_9]HCM27803.1 hypothetical protein [Treponema sp.]